MDESLKMKRAAQMKEEQEQLAFDRKILEQLLAQSQAEQLEQAQKKVNNSHFSILTFYFCRTLLYRDLSREMIVK